jgi:hypothetical protein
MGGSGSSFHWINDPEKSAKKLRDAEQSSIERSFNVQVSALLSDILSKINNRNVELIQQHLSNVIKTLETDIEGTLDVRYGGSVAKHTYVDGISDIDTLAIINNSELNDKSPGEVKEYFFQKLIQRFPNTEIIKRNLAVTIKYSDGTELQILPALKTQSGYKIAQDDQTWNHINPRQFVISLRACNIASEGKLVPMIKLAKSIISDLPENRRVSGYHTEALAVNIFNNYEGDKNTKDMLIHFFKNAANKVLTPIKDRTGQSIHVDEYLGENNSLKRNMISDSFEQIARKMQNADGSQIIEKWKDILNY